MPEESGLYEDIQVAIKATCEGPMNCILEYTKDDVVSNDFIGDAKSNIFDAKVGIAVSDKFMKLVTWYNNEWGYNNRVVVLFKHMFGVKANLN